MTELLDQVLPHVAQPDELGVQQIELHAIQEVSQTPLTSALASIASTRPLVTSAGSVRSVRVMLLSRQRRVSGNEEDGKYLELSKGQHNNNNRL